MFELLLPGDVARQHESRILEVAPSRLRIVLDPDVSRAEIAVTGSYDRPFEEIVADMPSLRWIHSTSAGIDALHSPEIEARGLLLTSSAGVYAPAMAEYAIAAMVFLARGWSTWLESQRERCWPDRSSSGTSLHGKVLGIVGYGGVGRHLASAAKALGMTVLATRRTTLVTSAEPLDVLLSAEALSRLLEDSDFVVVSASLNSTTRGLIGDRELRTMKQGAFLINLSRGALIDQDALVQALTDRRIGGAVIDVANPEPLPSGSPLWNAPNLWITPHVAGDTVQGRQAAIDLLCENLRLYVRGEADRMTNLVDVRAHR